MMAMQKIDAHESVWLSGLLSGIVPVASEDDRVVMGLTMDSRRVRPGDVFLACHGSRSCGHDFITEAVRYGAVAVVYESPYAPLPRLPVRVPMIGVDGLANKAGAIAERFYRNPSRALRAIGVTGTNGKTSTTHFIAHALSKGMPTPCGLVGTLGSGLYGNLNPGLHTTPDPVTLHALLAEVRDAGATDVVMEVSSHGLVQGRVEAVQFDTAVFTNLSRDHLDYHLDMDAYAQAKRRLFTFPSLRAAVINLDDEQGWAALNVVDPRVRIVGYTLAQDVGVIQRRLGRANTLVLVRGQIGSADCAGMQLSVESELGAGSLHTSLLGRFNASNLLAALGVLLMRGVAMDDALARLATVRPVAGRLEGYGGRGQPLVVVDYAHTPDALEQVLITLRALCHGRLWCVFGCGGNRDRGKRPQMGAIAQRLADRVIVTDDNPRFEEAPSIVADILSGMQQPQSATVIHARSEAIAYAVGGAAAQDVVLIAGKGHEDYQEVKGQRKPFSDREQVAWLLRESPRN
jgi:UDP-N-acetylmuramoyl-L-alanyl-D-glutamate--2,6-diaminopimelate ligase